MRYEFSISCTYACLATSAGKNLLAEYITEIFDLPLNSKIRLYDLSNRCVSSLGKECHYYPRSSADNVFVDNGMMFGDSSSLYTQYPQRPDILPQSRQYNTDLSYYNFSDSNGYYFEWSYILPRQKHQKKNLSGISGKQDNYRGVAHRNYSHIKENLGNKAQKKPGFVLQEDTSTDQRKGVPAWSKMRSVIKSMQGDSIQKYDPSVPSDLGCARFVSFVLNKTYGLPIYDINVKTLENSLKTQGFKTVSTMREGDIIIAHRKPGQHGHAGIYLGEGKVANNSSYLRRIAVQNVSKFSDPSYQHVTIYRKMA